MSEGVRRAGQSGRSDEGAHTCRGASLLCGPRPSVGVTRWVPPSGVHLGDCTQGSLCRPRGNWAAGNASSPTHQKWWWFEVEK